MTLCKRKREFSLYRLKRAFLIGFAFVAVTRSMVRRGLPLTSRHRSWWSRWCRERSLRKAIYIGLKSVRRVSPEKGNHREKKQTKLVFLTQPRDVSFPFAYEEVANLLGANGYTYFLHTQGTFDLNLYSAENQIHPGPF